VSAERFEVTLADGRTLDAIDEGDPDGMLLVFHHGSPGSAYPYPTFDRAAAERGIRLVEYSRAGYGGSSRKEGRSVADGAADTAALADALETDRFLVAGWSGGGPHALACAALLPDRVLACATIAGVGAWGQDDLDWLAGMGEDNVVEYSTAERDPAALLEWMRPHVEMLASVEPDEIVGDMRTLISDVDEAALSGELGEVIAGSFHGAFRDGPWGWYDDDLAYTRPWGFDLSSIRVPVAVWQGAHDLMVPFAHGEWLVEHVPSAHPRLHPEHGHLSIAVGMIGEIFDDLLALAKGESRGGAA
jgi:pimeloyl-ACP methyl ester carboxylesterase